MKKKIVSSLVLVTLVGSVFAGMSASANTSNIASHAINSQQKIDETTVNIEYAKNEITPVASNESELSQNNKNVTKISEQEAKEIALKHADVKEADTTNLKIKLDTEDGVVIYEIEFNVETKEYDYDIHATNGNIISYDVDHEDDKDDDNNNSSSNNNASNEGTPSNIISEAEAKKIALEKVPGASDSDIRIHLDNDEGRYVYEGTIIYDSKEYDFEINAQSGNVIEWDSESVYEK